MKRFISIFGLLFLASCGEETISNHSPCFLVVLSDALPVQFWLADCDTYNETVPKGVHEKCFCAPWNCNDQIRIQFTEDFSPDADYSLLVRNDDLQYVAQLPFTEIEAGVHSVAFSPETEGICDDVIALEIAEDADLVSLLAPSAWTQPSAPFDGAGSITFEHDVDGGDGIGGLRAYQPADIPAGETISFNVRVSILGTFTFSPVPESGIDIFFYLADGSGTDVSTDTSEQTRYTVAGVYETIITLRADSAASRLYFAIDERNMASGPAEVAVSITNGIYNPTFIIYSPSLAKSDCLDIKLAHDETELFEYSNGRNFAGLIHQDISPDATFNIRIPCRFFHEVFPEEDEGMELTSQVITTSSQLKSQKLLEVQMAPYYFHKKIQLVLKHHTLTNNDIAYKKEEKYEIIPGNKQWPLKQATCLLTEKSSVLRNVL